MSEERTERRNSPRTTAHDVVAARVRPGRQVSVIDLSASGALVETSHRLLPGTTVELQVDATDRSATMRGRVMRCAVSQVRSSLVCYRGAIAFERHLPWFVNEEGSGYGVHTSENRSGHPFRADATPQLL
jgi:hypothetical protein